MSPGMRQFGRFLLIDGVQEGRFGRVWQAVRMDESGLEHLCIQPLKIGLTASEDFVHKLADAVQWAVDHPKDGLNSVLELGIVGRQYYLAGQVPFGHTLQTFVDRCSALDAVIPIPLVVDFAMQCLSALDDALGGENDHPWCGDLHPNNIWLDYDGRLTLGWDGLKCVDPELPEQSASLLGTGVARIVETLGSALVAKDSDDKVGSIPEGLSQWLRTTLAGAGELCDPKALAASLRPFWDEPSSDDRAFIGSVFTRERAIQDARNDRLTQRLQGMPPGARKVIAQANTQIIVNHQRQGDTVAVEHVPDSTPPSDALFYGDLNGLDMGRLLYRYAVVQVNGRLEIQGPQGPVSIEWRNGQIVRTYSRVPGKTLSDYVVEHELTDRSTLESSRSNGDQNEGELVRAIVSQGHVGHHEVLAAFQGYSCQIIMALLERERATYIFVGEMGDCTFSYGPEASVFAILNHGFMSRIPQKRIDDFLHPHMDNIVIRLDHKHLSAGDLRLTTRQLRVWNAVQSGHALDAQLLRLTAIPGVDQDFAARVLALMERMDFLCFESP